MLQQFDRNGRTPDFRSVGHERQQRGKSTLSSLLTADKAAPQAQHV